MGDVDVVLAWRAATRDDHEAPRWALVRRGDDLAIALEASEAALRSIASKPRPSGTWCQAVARAYLEGRLSAARDPLLAAAVLSQGSEA